MHEKNIKQKKLSAPLTPRKISEAFASGEVKKSKSDVVKIAEIKLTSFMVEHNVSFRAADHLCDVVTDCFPDSAIAKELHMKKERNATVSVRKT